MYRVSSVYFEMVSDLRYHCRTHLDGEPVYRFGADKVRSISSPTFLALRVARSASKM